MSQRKDVECTGCGNLIGVEHSYNWGSYGQDPPEIIWEDEDSVVFDDDNNPFCTQECMDGYHGSKEESEEENEEDEEDAQRRLFTSEICDCGEGGQSHEEQDEFDG